VSNSPESGRKVSNKPKRANGRGSIYQITKSNGRKVWKAAIKDINGKLRTKNFTKFAEAEDWIAEQRRARELGENTYATNPKMTVSEFMIGWVENKYSDDQSNTQRFYRNAIKNHIIPALGNIKASSLTTKSIESLLRDMAARQLGAGTIKSVKASLSAAFNDAVRLGDLTRNPMKNVKMPDIQAKPTKPLPRNDWEKIYLEAMKDPYMHARIEVAGMLGLRPGEALGLKWKDLNLQESSLHVVRQVQRVKGKGLVIKAVKQKKERTLAISDTTVQILLTHKRYQALQKAAWTEDLDLLFPNSLGKPQDEKADRNAFKKLLKNAGAPNYELYQLRKTCFTAMASQTDLKTLMEFTGHTQVSTVLGSYVFATSESMAKAVNGMDKLRPVSGN
jgi:integrase